MRRLPKLTKPKHIDREFTIKDFQNFSEKSDGLKATDNGLATAKLPIEIGNFSSEEIKRLYCVRNRLYAYLATGSLVGYVNGEWVEITTSAKEPYVVSYEKDGEDCTLIVGDSSLIVYDDQTTAYEQAIYGTRAVIYKGMMFVANGNELSFSKLFSYHDFSIGLTNAGFITTDKDYGEIIGLIPTKETLIIICQNAIYNLYPVGNRENYSLVKQDVALKAVKNSVQSAGNLTYLFSDEVFCKYQGGKLSKVECKLDFNEYDFDGQSGVDGNTYFATLINKLTGEKYLYTFNGVSGEENLIKTQNVSLADNGYFIEGQSVKKFDVQNQEGFNGEWRSVDLDFGSPKLKTLVEIAVRSHAPIDLEIKTSYASFNYKFDVGYNEFKTNLSDKSFKIKVNTQTFGASVELIKFTYRLQEE